MRLSIAPIIVLAICTGSFAQGVVGWINLENQVVLEPVGGRAVDLVSVDIQSDAGLLIPSESTFPDQFTFFLSNTEQQVTLGSLGVGPRIREGTALDVRYDLQSAIEMGLNPCEEISLGLPGAGAATPFCAIPGDADFSGKVDFSDFLIVSANFGKAESVWPSGDFDSDRTTGFTDFVQLSANFGADSNDLLVQPGEPAIVRASTSEEIEHLSGDFSPPLTVDADYLVDGGLWLRRSAEVPDAEQLLEDTPISIVATEIEYPSPFELTRVGQTFEIVSVQLRSSSQGSFPVDPPRSLVLPIGTLDSGQYEVGITRYEFIDDSELAEFDASGFLADPMNFELPEGPRLSSITTSTLSFQVGALESVSVPEPRFQLFSISMVFLAGLSIRLTASRRRPSEADLHETERGQ